MTSDEFNALAWRDFVLWAWSSPDLRAQFAAETGSDLPAASSQIEAMIDEATGAASDRASAFIEWVTREYWGLEQAPVAYQAAIAPRTSTTS